MPEVSAKELKAQKKAQKQAQRAARKDGAAPGGGAAQSGDRKAPGSAATGGPGQFPNQNSTQNHGPPNHPAGVRLFDHLEQPRPVAAGKDVHPAILHLALQMQQCKIIGSSERCKAMLVAFQRVIADYETPPDTTLSRSLAVHLSHQIEVLKTGRALSVSMGNAIRWLKQQTSGLDPDVNEEQAKQDLVDLIRAFIRERLDMADRVIVESMRDMIKHGSRILTFGRSEVVYRALADAKERGVDFSVVCVDSQPLLEGKKLARELVALRVPATYVLVNTLPYVMDTVSVVLIGAHAMVSNGHLFSRVGTSLVAMAASARSIPVLVLCETLKFSERVQLDAFSSNELLPTDVAPSTHSNSVFYDLTDQKYISKVVTELGSLPASSVPVILREYKMQLV